MNGRMNEQTGIPRSLGDHSDDRFRLIMPRWPLGVYFRQTSSVSVRFRSPPFRSVGHVERLFALASIERFDCESEENGMKRKNKDKTSGEKTYNIVEKRSIKECLL